MNRILSLSVAMIFGLFAQSNAMVDSLGIEQVDGKKYVLHRVEKSEGLYAIARKYGSTAKAIEEANSLSTTMLELGQVLRVPYSGKTNTSVALYNAVKSEELVQKLPPANTKINTSQYTVHVVKKSETLYAIAKKYGMSVTELKNYNALTVNSLEVGQKLKIPKRNVIQNPDLIEADPNAVGEVTSSKGTADVKVSTRNNTYLNSTDYVENGVAGWINDKNLNPNKSIALHKTAPIGTIMRVTNLMNNRSIYVKVVGTLPETGDNENTIIVLSKAAVKMLGATESKFRVSLNYSIPKD